MAFLRSFFNLFMMFVLVGGCGNQPIPKSKLKPDLGLKQSFTVKAPQQSYPVGRVVRLLFEAKPLAQGQTYKVVGYMKCCKSPLRIKIKSLGDDLAVDVEEFWSEGIYVFELMIVDSKSEVVLLTQFELQAR